MALIYVACGDAALASSQLSVLLLEAKDQFGINRLLSWARRDISIIIRGSLSMVAGDPTARAPS